VVKTSHIALTSRSLRHTNPDRSLDENSEVVAVKIVNIDDMDFNAEFHQRDETVKDFRKEVGILQQLKDSGARNVNLIHDAFDLHSQLWIVSDYCTGGSVRTLMRGNPTPPLEEHFIVPIARELAVAMKCVHDIGVIHRDIKCTNVYVTEDGRIQLGDFGIVGVMDDGASKRTTIVGTPWYMPREMLIPANSVVQGYGFEVDVWAYGCTVYEMATGQVPNQNIHPDYLNSALENAPRLTGDNYSEDLRDFVAWCLNNDPKARPTVEEILQHPFIAGTEQTHPTNSLIALIERYTMWEFKGGQRASLFNPGGAAAPVGADEIEEDSGNDFDWNFSLSEGFNQSFTRRYSQMLLNGLDGLPQEVSGDSGLPQLGTKGLSVLEQIQREHKEKSATRGEGYLDRLFNPDSAPYEMHAATITPSSPEVNSDLPLRSKEESTAMRESTIMIDLDAEPDYGRKPDFQFDFDTVKARAKTSYADDDDDDDVQEEEQDDYQYGQFNDDKRATKDWQFPSVSTSATVPKRATMDWSFANAQPADSGSADTTLNLESPNDSGTIAPGFRPQLLHTATVPLGQFGDYLHTNQPTNLLAPSNDPVSRDSMNSMIDLDLAFAGDTELPPRPSTASSASGSTGTEMTSGDPFDLEDDHGQFGGDRNRFSYHKQWQSDGGPADINRVSLRNVPMHARGSSLSSTASELERNVQVPAAAEDVFAYDYEHPSNTSTRKPMQLRLSHGDATGPSTAPLSSQTDWPDFNRDYTSSDSPGYAAHNIPQLGDPSFPLAGHNHMIGSSAAMPRSPSVSQSRDTINGGTFGTPGGSKDTLEFPNVVPPNPAALDEDASAATLAADLDRMLDDMRGALKSTGRALRQRTGLSGEAAGFSDGGFSSFDEETDAGFESTSSIGFRSGMETGDEEGF
jgi:serine/threonine protein kinase